MEIAFHGKRALVTGAGRGVGRELVKRLAKYGAKVVALSRGMEPLESLKKEVPGIEIVCVDLGDWDSTNIAVGKIGHVDLLVNNAAISERILFGDFTEKDFDRTMNINLKGLLNVSQVVAKGMKAKGTGGSIVNISSDLSVKAVEGFAVYAASKAAMVQMSRVMAVELGPSKIRVNTVHPTLINTEMVADFIKNHAAPFIAEIPMGRVCEISEVVDTVVYLLSDKASMIHGACIYVDGGSTTK